MELFIIVVATLAELVLIALLFSFFNRLRRSEDALVKLQQQQAQVLERIQDNAQLEQELVNSFAQRQEQLQHLNHQMAERIETLQRLLAQAEGIARSPQFLREIIQNGKRKGLDSQQIARNAAISVDEVELIMEQMK